MAKYCPNCGKKNPEDGFWCTNCNAKLVKKLTIQKEETPSKPLHMGYKAPQESYLSLKQTRRYGIKILIFIVALIFLVTIIAAYLSLSMGSDFSGINCEINEDFWFEENYLNTSDGWTFTMTKVKDYTLDGIILGLKTYNKNDIPYRPINIFSPIDLYIGVDDVKENPDKYPFTITSFDDRMGWTVFKGQSSADRNYFKTHTGNNHVIPHNQKVLDELHNISVNDHVIIEGSLVNLYGTRGNEYYRWNTDTHIGNFDCEIILVDIITINASQ